MSSGAKTELKDKQRKIRGGSDVNDLLPVMCSLVSTNSDGLKAGSDDKYASTLPCNLVLNKTKHSGSLETGSDVKDNASDVQSCVIDNTGLDALQRK